MDNGKAMAFPAVTYLDNVVKDLLKVRYFRQTADWSVKNMAKMKLHTARTSIVSDKFKKTAASLLTHHVTPQLLVGAGQEYDEFFEMQLFGLVEGYKHISASTFCLPECRLTLEGSEITAGLKVELLDGDDMRQKCAQMTKMSFAEFAQLAAEGGFVHVSAPGTLLVLPPGFLFMQAAKKTTQGLRWSFWDQERAGAVKSMLDAFFSAWPTLCNSNFAEIKKWVDAQQEDVD